MTNEHSDENEQDETTNRTATDPKSPTHEATEPPGEGGGIDPSLVDRAQEQLRKAGGGH